MTSPEDRELAEGFFGSLAFPKSPASRKILEEMCWQRFEEGKGSALLWLAVAYLRPDAPKRLQDELLRVIWGVQDYQTWDELLGPTRPKNLQVHAVRKAQRLRLTAYAAVLNLRAKEKRKDHFPTVAKKLGIGRDQCKKYFRSGRREYLWWVKNWGQKRADALLDATLAEYELL